MNNYFKYIIGSALSVLFLMQTSFAVIFNESRKVFLPKYSNAVYGSLSVRDTMYLNYGVPTISEAKFGFFMEIGQRPRYFWNIDRKYHYLQNQTLKLDKSHYLSKDGQNLDADNYFMIFDTQIPKGVFIGTGLSLLDGSTVSIQGNETNFITNFRSSYPISLTLGGLVTNFTVFTHNLDFAMNDTYGNNVIIENMLLRDYAYKISSNKIVPFPSPRIMIYQNDKKYKSAGSATKFALKDLPDTTPKSYYGPWLVADPTNISTIATCPETKRCEKIRYTNTYNDKSGRIERSPDKINMEFECAGEFWDATNAISEKWYDVDTGDDNGCFDYQLVQMPQINLKPAVYDSNGAVYEFKVQEVVQRYNTNNTLYHLKSQKPEFRLTGVNQRLAAISLISGDSWTINNSNISYPNYVLVGGHVIWISQLKKVPDDASYNDICYMLCGGKVCKENIAFVRETREGGVTTTNRGVAPPSSYNPVETPANPYDPPVGMMEWSTFVYTYKVGVCLAQQKASYTTTEYEQNYDQSNFDNLMAGLAVETETDEYQAPKVCIKRVVRCNKINNENRQKRRTYKVLAAE